MITDGGPSAIRIAQYGTQHGHAAGWAEAMLANPNVELVGVYEPDRARMADLRASGSPPWSEVRWFQDKTEFLDDPTIQAIASEGSNAESLAQTEEIVSAGKHVLYDKPAGDDYPRLERLLSTARQGRLLVQMGYMWRYHDGFSRIAEWARSGFLGKVFGIRAHVSTNLTPEATSVIASHTGGIFYDLAGHVIDQIVWILGRPDKVTSFLRQDSFVTEGFTDNALGVFEYEGAMAIVDIAAMESPPMARRFEVYGTEGSAVMEPFEPAGTIRLCLREPKGGYPSGISTIEIEDRPRYDAPLAAFLRDLRGEKEPDRSMEHDLTVQETLLRATGGIVG
jgi:predicted dehydrogenase